MSIEDTIISLKSRIELFKIEHSWVWDADKDTVQAKDFTGRDAQQRKALERPSDAQAFRKDGMGS